MTAFDPTPEPRTAPGSVPQEPARSVFDPGELLRAHLDRYRDLVLHKLAGLPESELRGSRLPSGWTPLELLKHLTHVERRWVRWGFLAEPVDRPWGDRGADGRWEVSADEPAQALREAFAEQCTRSREILGGRSLDERARVGGRFATEAEAPSLGWILFHLLQEYARHVGHLDIVRELADGATGE